MHNSILTNNIVAPCRPSTYILSQHQIGPVLPSTHNVTFANVNESTNLFHTDIVFSCVLRMAEKMFKPKRKIPVFRHNFLTETADRIDALRIIDPSNPDIQTLSKDINISYQKSNNLATKPKNLSINVTNNLHLTRKIMMSNKRNNSGTF